MRICRTSMALALGALAWGAPASAADPATAACVRQTLDPPSGESLAQGLGDPDIDSEDMASDGDYAQLGSAMLVCQEKYAWSEAAVDAAMTYTIAELGMRGASALMQEAGIDPIAAARAVAGLSAPDRAVLLADPESDRIGPMMMAAAADAGLPFDTDRQRALLTVLASYMVQKDDALRTFTDE